VIGKLAKNGFIKKQKPVLELLVINSLMSFIAY